MTSLISKVISRPGLRYELIYYYCFIAAVSIAVSAYTGINGTNPWRQADVYAHILGFTSDKAMRPMTNFLGDKTVYDVPLYQLVVAKISAVIRSEPLVVARIINIGLWLVTACVGLRLAELIKAGSGLYFLFLIVTSPLFIHYYSAPIPDGMAIGLSLLGVWLILIRREEWYISVLAGVCISVASLIKSPIPYAFCAFLVVYVLVQQNDLLRRRSFWAFLLCALLGALAAEAVRNAIIGRHILGFAQDDSYFGTLDFRLSREFWQTLLLRSTVDPFAHWLVWVAAALTGAALIRDKAKIRNISKTILALAAAVMAGWLTFPLLYFYHDYYQLSASILIFLAIAIWLAEAFGSIDGARWAIAHILLGAVAAAVIVLGVSKRNLEVASVYDGFSYMMRGKTSFLYVDGIEDDDDTSIGGFVKTQFVRVRPVEFELRCRKYLSDYEAILVRGRSECVTQNRAESTGYMETGKFQLLIRQ